MKKTRYSVVLTNMTCRKCRNIHSTRRFIEGNPAAVSRVFRVMVIDPRTLGYQTVFHRDGRGRVRINLINVKIQPRKQLRACGCE